METLTTKQALSELLEMLSAAYHNGGRDAFNRLKFGRYMGTDEQVQDYLSTLRELVRNSVDAEPVCYFLVADIARACGAEATFSTDGGAMVGLIADGWDGEVVIDSEGQTVSYPHTLPRGDVLKIHGAATLADYTPSEYAVAKWGAK